jgi:hypothetical protein
LLTFGAQPNTETLANAPIPVGEGKSPVLGILGGFLILFSIGLGIYTAIFNKK